MRLLKLLAVLVILMVAGLAGYAYFGDMSSAPREMRMPVALDLGAAPAPNGTAPAAQGDDAAATTPADTGAGQDDLD